jgi:integrase/recombinase XerD
VAGTITGSGIRWHSMLAHEAENGTNTPTLLARARRTSVRSLERYARPGPEAVARH